MVLLAVLLPTLSFALCLAAGLIFIGLKPFRTLKSSKRSVSGVATHSTRSLPYLPGRESDVETGNNKIPELSSKGFVPRSITWDGVEYSVKSRNGPRKVILNGCSGRVLPGELLAIVGPSGAGKSTLLDVLAMRAPRSGGEVLVDGLPQTSQFNHISTYVPQEDAFVPTLSVWETLLFHCCLRLPQDVSRERREEVMEATLNSMGLGKVIHSQVGGVLPGGLPVRGLSGGERRRLHIACGVVAAPSIIFLDEPTSGLDSHAALVLMKHMRGLASASRTVICSIHQPRQAIWDMFDKLEILSEGHLLYFGATGEAVHWFQCLGFRYAESQGAVSDWLLDLVSVGFHESMGGATGLASLDDVAAASARFREEILPIHMRLSEKDEDLEEALHTTDIASGSLSRLQSYPTSWLNQMRVLFWRAVLSLTRNPADTLGRLLLSMFVGLTLGWVMMSRRGVATATDTFTITYFVCQSIQLLPFAYMSLYVADRRFYIADVASNLYHPSAYHVATTLAAAPSTIINGVVLYFIAYGMVSLRYTAQAIFWTGIVAAGHSLLSIQVVALAAYMTPNQDMAFIAGIGYGLVGSLLAGFIVKLPDMQPVLYGVSFITPFRYSFQIFMKIQLHGTPGQSLLRYMGITLGYATNAAAMVAIFVVLHILSYAALRFLHRPHTAKSS